MSDSHLVISHAVLPSPIPWLYQALPSPEPSTVTLVDPDAMMFPVRAVLSCGTDDDRVSVALPTSLAADTTIRLLPITL